MNVTGDPLPQDLAEALQAAGERLSPFGRRILFFDSIDSTNNVALAAAADGMLDMVVIADAQTAGRGRYGRTWHSPAGSGLYVSVVLGMPAEGGDASRVTSLLTLAAGVGLAEAIERVGVLRVSIKWPNDLIVSGRKVGGILAERTAQPSSIILGFGLNVRAIEFPPALMDRATTLEVELGHTVDRAVLCAASLVALSRRYHDLLAGRFDAILDAWRQRAFQHEGASVAWRTPQGRHQGVTRGIDDDGALLVDVEGRLERIVGGELDWL